MEYTAKEIAEGDHGDDVQVLQDAKPIGTWRWGTCHQTVVKDGDDIWAVNFRTQPEEGIQDCGPLYRVVAQAKTVFEYVPTEDARDGHG